MLSFEMFRVLSNVSPIVSVMLAAMSMANDRDRYLAAGANAFIIKPISVAQIESVLMRYLN